MTPSIHLRSRSLWIAFLDLLCLAAGCVAGLLLSVPQWRRSELFMGHSEGFVLLAVGVLLANYLAGTYNLQYTFSRFNLIVTWLFSIVFSMLFLGLTSASWIRIFWLREVLVTSLAAYSALSLGLKLLAYRDMFRSKFFRCRTAVVGTGPLATQLQGVLEGSYVMPTHEVVGIVRVEGADDKEGGEDEGRVIECRLSGLASLLHGLDVRLVVLAESDPARQRTYYPALRRLRFEGVEILTPAAAAEIYEGRTPVCTLTEDSLMSATMESGMPLYRRTKRVLEVLIASVLLLLSLPLLLAIGLCMKLQDPRLPFLFRQERVGLFGRHFRIVKIRTMRVAVGRDVATWCGPDDPRVTRFGRVLRYYRVDEFPQLWNVIVGDMSLVGPRPEQPEIVAQLEAEIPFYGERHHVPPGLTGWAQIWYPYGRSVYDAKRKLEYDLYYIKHLSANLDLQIILRTVRIVVLGMDRCMGNSLSAQLLLPDGSN